MIFMKATRKRCQTTPQEGNLGFVQHHVYDARKARELEARWLGPQMLVRYTSSRNSASADGLHGTGQLRNYHTSDLISNLEEAADKRWESSKIELFNASCERSFPSYWISDHLLDDGYEWQGAQEQS